MTEPANQAPAAPVPDGDEDGPPGPEAATASGRRLRWWREALYVVLFYYVGYSQIRNLFGSNGAGSAEIAFDHAKGVIRVQEAMGLWFEPALQRWYLDLPAMGLIRIWNIYYGTAHFVVTALALVWVYRRQPDRYSLWRNTLALMTALALIGFATYSLMPPRLLDDTSKFGACYEEQVQACHGYDVVDTLAVHGGLWSFGSGAMAEVSNQYAAMPSMHTGWSTWSACVLWGLTRRRWLRALAVLYPVATVFCILITGNHFWLDAVGGLAAFGVGFGLAKVITAWNERRFLAREATAVPA